MPANRPNLLLIMSDDQGPWAMGCAGARELRTPTLDRLAAEGVRFDQFFCASPVCSPARASWLTGRIPSQHGVQDWLRSGNIDVAAGVTWCGQDRPIEYLAGLPGFTDMLAGAGYRCGHSGKWHLGDSARPQKGHTWWYAYSLGGDNYHNWSGFDNTPKLIKHPEYVTTYYTDRALEFLDAHGRGPQPWCLSVHYTAPHAPWGREQHPAQLYDSYRDCGFASLPREQPHPWGGWKANDEQRRNQAAGYFAAITAMDAEIGRLLARLGALGLRENTLVVFTSDNGFCFGHHGICGKGNGTFPLNMYEESVKVPFIASQPGAVPTGLVESGLWSHYDWFPTLGDLLGLPTPQAERLPGRSFAGVLRGQPASGHDQVVVCEEYGPVRMIRDREWKYVHRYPYGPHELYHLREDPGEKTNRVDDKACAEVLTNLRGRLGAWFARYVDPQRDGALEGVTGLGQIDLCGRQGGGRPAFWPRPVNKT